MPIKNCDYTLLLIITAPEELSEIAAMLKTAAFNVIPTSSHTEALRQTTAEIPDMIILDRNESAEKEFATIRLLKKNKATQNIPVLFFTSAANDAPIPESLSYDNIDFITKPFRQQELVIRIQHQLFLFEAQRLIWKQNEQLKKTIESRDKLYSVIAHDLRAPISTIKMISATIENKKENINNPEIVRLFEMISETTEQAFNLLENLLRWSRNQNGSTKTAATIFNISATTRQIVSLFATIANAKNISLNNRITEDTPVYADEDMIKTVLRNLISNAIKFTFSGGQIDISLTKDQNLVTLSVKDNGQGISNEIQGKLLKNNEHITSYGTRNEKGCGLGLLLCKDFVKINGGKLWFESQEGKGSTFHFTLPRTIPAPHHRAANS